MRKTVFSNHKGAVRVTSDGESVGYLRAYVVRPGNNSFFHPWECVAADVEAGGESWRIEWQCADEGVRINLDLAAHKTGYAGILRASGKGSCVVRVVWELPAGLRGFPFVPAFMYGYNEGGNSPWAVYPRLTESEALHWDKPWIAGEWLVRADRSSHGLTSVIADNEVYAIGGRDVCMYADGSVAEKNGLGISASDPHRLTFSLGFSNVPFTYSVLPGRNCISRTEGYVDLDRGEVSSQFFLFHYEHDCRQKGIARLLRESYALLHDPIREDGDISEAVRAVANALVEYGYSGEAKNFHVTLFEDGRIAQSRPERFDSAWSGGMRTAYPLLMAGHQLGEDRWTQCARDVCSSIATNAVSEKSGLFFEAFDIGSGQWTSRGWWYGMLEKPGHSGYINGQVCHYLLHAYLVEKSAGMDHPEWLTAAQRVLDHVAETQGGDGRFGYTYSEEDGSILDGDGFSGCWFTPAFASLCRITGDKKYLDIARRAMDFYRQYVEGFHVWGGPHDIFKSPDEEGILAWIEAARLLHEITGEEQFLEDLLMGLDYEFSWKFAYNVVNEVEPLKSRNWCSTGGSVTSVNNSHIHPMGSQITNSILYAAELTGDPYIRSRLVDTLRWTLAAYLQHDGDYGWGKMGMINERFCYTDALLMERFPDGSPASTWFSAHSWASGAVLEGVTGRILDKAGTEEWKCLSYKP